MGLREEYGLWILLTRFLNLQITVTGSLLSFVNDDANFFSVYNNIILNKKGMCTSEIRANHCTEISLSLVLLFLTQDKWKSGNL